MYEIITEKEPFLKYSSKRKLVHDVVKGIRPNLSMIKNEEIQLFIQKCWSNNPNERPTFSMIVEEIMKESFREYFDCDIKEVIHYLDLFDEDLKNYNKCNDFDFQKESNKGNAQITYLFGSMMYYGIGSVCNKIEAIRLFKIAADQGCSDAMFAYASKLFDGDYIKFDKKEAVKYFKMVADLGNTSAMNDYAILLFEGLYVEKK